MTVFFEFLKTNQDAFTVIGIVITFLISIFSLFYNVKNNKAVHYVNSVTKNRVEWIDKLRKNVSKFISILDTQDLTYTVAKTEDIIKYPFSENLYKLNQIGSEIKLMLNFSDDFDREIMDQIDIIILTYKNLYVTTQSCIIENTKKKSPLFVPSDELMKKQTDIDSLTQKLLSDMQIYLKSEWNRVKYESCGKTYEKETQIFDLEELKQKKSAPSYKNNYWKRFCINLKAKCKRIWNSNQLTIILAIIALLLIVLKVSSLFDYICNLFNK